MSTRILNGYRLAAGTDPFAFCARLRGILNPIRDELDAKLLAALCTARFDRVWLAGEAMTEGTALPTLLDWDEKQDKLKPTDRGHDPNSFALCVGADPGTGRHLLLVFTQQPALRDAFAACEEVEEFSYWNNYDPPVGASKEDWDARRASWDRVRPNDYTAPSEFMLTMNLRSPSNPGMMMLLVEDGRRDLVTPNIPDRATRSKNSASRVYAEYLLNALGFEGASRHADTRSDVTGIAAVMEPHLPELDRKALVHGLSGASISPEVAAAIRQACEYLYEREKITRAAS